LAVRRDQLGKIRGIDLVTVALFRHLTESGRLICDERFVASCDCSRFALLIPAVRVDPDEIEKPIKNKVLEDE
jgi:hypothetical protein